MEDENTKEELSVTGHDVPSLDADPIDAGTDAALDAALDQAISGAETSEEENLEQPIERQPEADSQFQRQIQPEQQNPTEIDPEISAIEQPRNLSEKNQSNWRKLQEAASNYKKKAEEVENIRKQLSEIEEMSKAIPENYDELKKFRAFFDLQNDSDFQEKYDSPIKTAKENIYAIMKRHGAPDEVIQSIERAGGPEKINQQWWVENAINKLPLTEGEKLKRSLVDMVDLQEKRQEELQKSVANVAEYYQKRGEEAHSWYENQEKEIETYIRSRIKEQNAEWAMRKEIPKAATKEQAEAITRHNKQVDQLEQYFGSALWPSTPQERADVAAAAAMSHILTEQLRTEQTSRQKLSAQLKALQEENTRLKGAGKVPRQSLPSVSANKQMSVNDRLKMSSMDAIEFGLEEAGA
jgi:hypothetical protein